MQTEAQSKRNNRGVLVTFLKVRQMPIATGVNANGEPFKIGGEFAVINSNDRNFEPGGSSWPHLIRCESKESAEAYARACCKPHPQYGAWYELVEDAGAAA